MCLCLQYALCLFLTFRELSNISDVGRHSNFLEAKRLRTSEGDNAQKKPVGRKNVAAKSIPNGTVRTDFTLLLDRLAGM